jgi:CHAD domain-containing protein
MAYRFERDEIAPAAAARCAREQLDGAIAQLSEGVRDDPEEAVHSARKSIKKARAVLRLMRGPLPRDQRRAENSALRDAAHELSPTRDADVMISTLNQLSERFAGQVPQSAFRAVKERLDRPRTAPPLPTDAVEDLRAIRGRIDEWHLGRDGWDAIKPGLKRTYRQGRNAFTQARSDPSFENLHEWRKRVKDLWYELRLLGGVCGPMARGQAKEADQLGELLGDDHDLGVLRRALVGPAGEVPVDVGALLAIIDHRRSELQAEAMRSGERLYAEKPKAFVRRIHRLWQSGRAEERDAVARRPAELADSTRTMTAA